MAHFSWQPVRVLSYLPLIKDKHTASRRREKEKKKTKPISKRG